MKRNTLFGALTAIGVTLWAAGAGASPPPATWPNASRAPNTDRTRTRLSATASGLVKKRATRPVSSGASSSSTTTGRRIGTGATVSFAARRRSATSCAWLNAAEEMSPTKSRPCR